MKLSFLDSTIINSSDSVEFNKSWLIKNQCPLTSVCAKSNKNDHCAPGGPCLHEGNVECNIETLYIFEAMFHFLYFEIYS